MNKIINHDIKPFCKYSIVVLFGLTLGCNSEKANTSEKLNKTKKELITTDDVEQFFNEEDSLYGYKRTINLNNGTKIGFTLNRQPYCGYYSVIGEKDTIYKFYKRVYSKFLNDWFIDEIISTNQKGEIIKSLGFYISINKLNLYEYYLETSVIDYFMKLNFEYSRAEYSFSYNDSIIQKGSITSEKDRILITHNYDTSILVFKFILEDTTTWREIEKVIYRK